MASLAIKGQLIIIVAPSGSGKSTLIERLKKDFPELRESISYTTRSPRAGEKDGIHYFFIDKNQFLNMIDRSEFVEWAQVHDHYYGTSKKFIREQLDQKNSILLDVDVQGTDKLKATFPYDTTAIFIAPPSIDELEKRLKRRGKDAQEVVLKRVHNAKQEILRQDDYDYKVINDQLEVAYQQLHTIVTQLLKKR